MAKAEPSGATRLTTEVLSKGIRILVPRAPPEAYQVLSELLRVWEQEALAEHLSLREVLLARTEQLADLRLQVAGLIASIEALDQAGWFEIACRPQAHKHADLNGRWDSVIAHAGSDLIAAGEQRRDNAVAWLRDLYDALAVPEPELPPECPSSGFSGQRAG